MAENVEKSLLDLDFASLTRRKSTPSPAAWEDQVLYFLLLDLKQATTFCLTRHEATQPLSPLGLQNRIN